MARNHRFYFDRDGSPKARGPGSEKLLMDFLEADVQGSDQICHDLMNDLTAIEQGSDDEREFIGNAHSVSITPDGIVIVALQTPPPVTGVTDTAGDARTTDTKPSDGTVDEFRYTTGLKHFREVLEDWEAFILDDQIDDAMLDDDLLA